MTTPPKTCRCGCGAPVSRRRVFLSKEHHLEWMVRGGAAAMNALQSIEGKAKGGSIVGRQLAASGHLAEAAKKGGAKSREIAQRVRGARNTNATPTI